MSIVKVILTSLLSVASLFVITKVMGHKQLSQLDFFDYLCGITIGSIGAELATELEKPLYPLIALIIYGIASFILNIITQKHQKSRKYINGTPSILMKDGKIYKENLKKSKLDLTDFLLLCREQGFFDKSDIACAVFEHTGKLSILPCSDKRPLTPSDMQLTPSKAELLTEVILDGRILEENLKRSGLNLTWLNKNLNEQGYKKAQEIYLGLLDSQGNLSLFKYN